MVPAHCMLDAKDYTHTHTHTHARTHTRTHAHTICNTYFFNTATMVTRTRLIVTLYVH